MPLLKLTKGTEPVYYQEGTLGEKGEEITQIEEAKEMPVTDLLVIITKNSRTKVPLPSKFTVTYMNET